jgi:hypothetical protein
MNNDVYDILKMQSDDMKKLNEDAQSLIDNNDDFNAQAREKMADHDAKFQENLAWVRSLGINPDLELEKAKLRNKFF